MPDFHKFFFVKGILIAAMFAALSFLAVIIISFTPVSGVPVLNYHQINDVDHNAMTITTKQFEAQMKYLSDNNYTAISPDQLIDHLETGAPLPPHPVLITFDDGYKDNYLNAFPILKKYQMTATIFLISDYVSTYEKYLTWDEIALMQRDGIDFESHTLSHMNLIEAASDEELQQQLAGSKAALEWHLGKQVNYIAYPCGTYNPKIMSQTKATGYRGAFTVNFGRDDHDDAQYALDRIPVFGGNSHTYLRFRLRLKLTPVFSYLDQLKTDLQKRGNTTLARIIPSP